jgi:hypothetical protein
VADPGERAAVVALRGIRLALSVSGVPNAERRSVEVYLLVTACGVHQAMAATACSCSKQNISKLIKAVEDRRSNLKFDAAIAVIEAVLMEA